jgi:TonB family protein
MNPPPLGKRLRDHAGDPSDPLNRAGELVRALPPPRPLDGAARARVRAALRDREPGSRARHGLRLSRVALQLATLVAVAATGFGASATLDWWHARRTPPAPVITPLPPPPVVVRRPAPPPPRVAAPAPPVRRPPPAPRPEPTPAPARGFVHAVRAIDPQSPAFRPQLPPEIAQAHARAGISTLVEVCVSAGGGVTSAKVLEQRHPLVDREIAAAIRRWRYQPALRNDQPVPSCLRFRYLLSWLAGAAPPASPPR